jgi:transposase
MSNGTTATKETGTSQSPRGVIGAADTKIREIRRATRRKFMAEEKIRVVIAGLKAEQPISDLCRYEGISSAIYYNWMKDFMEGGKARLRGDTTRDATKGDVETLKRENERLKTLVGEQALDIRMLKKSVVY